MASSEVSIANIAMTLLGQQTIISLTDDSNRANLANARFADVRDAVLRTHLWNCATKRAALSASATAPAWGYSTAYPLPVDFLRLASLSELGIDYRIEGRQLLTDASTINILYIYRVEDVSVWDELLKQAVAARLAAELALPITGSDSTATLMWQLYEAKMNEAKYIDSVEGPTDLDIRPSSWIEQRATESLSELAQRDVAGS